MIGCADRYAGPCPPYPHPGEKVADELAAVPFEGFEDFWEWMGQQEKLERQLALCRGEDPR